MTENQNLSQKLFTPKLTHQETSALISSTNSPNWLTNAKLDSEARANWYRVINRLSWHRQGLPVICVGDVLSRIAASKRKRSHENWLDTVIGYQPGNWIYEFLSEAVKWQQQAEKQQESGENSRCQQSWLNASLLASIASYPHYRNDDLANQAQFFANRYYHEAMNASPYHVKTLDFIVDNKTVKTLLHMPYKKQETPRVFPIVILCAGLDHLQTDFYHYFSQYLAPQGVGLLTVDTPSVGNSKQFNLSQNTSVILQSIIEQISSVPLIDRDKIILFGYRFGANIATRLAYLMPNRIKGVINFNPIVHQLFTDQHMQSQLPPLYRHLIASRLGFDAISDQQLAAELKFFSLKEQRLLAKPCSVPILNIVYEKEMISSLDEAKLITSTKKVSLIHIKALELQKRWQPSSQQAIRWINELVK